VAAAWRRAWDKVIPFFAFPPEVRKVIYTTNAIESVNARLRKTIKTRGHFPSDDAATKLICLALRNITADWGRPANTWKTAMNQFAILAGCERSFAATPRQPSPSDEVSSRGPAGTCADRAQTDLSSPPAVRQRP